MMLRRGEAIWGFSCFALSFRGIEDAGDGVGELGPAGTLCEQMLFAGVGEAVDADALFVLGKLPVGGDHFLTLETVQGGIEGAGVDLEDVVGVGFDGLADAVAVAGAPAEGLQDQEVESALEQLDAILIAIGHAPRPLGVESLHPACRTSTPMEKFIILFAYLLETGKCLAAKRLRQESAVC